MSKALALVIYIITTYFNQNKINIKQKIQTLRREGRKSESQATTLIFPIKHLNGHLHHSSFQQAPNDKLKRSKFTLLNLYAAGTNDLKVIAVALVPVATSVEPYRDVAVGCT